MTDRTKYFAEYYQKIKRRKTRGRKNFIRTTKNLR